MTLNGQYTHCFSVRHSADTIWIIASSCGLLVIARLNSCYLRIEVGRIVLNRGYRFLVQLDTVCQILQLKMSDDSFTLTPSFWNRHSIKYTHCITLECDKIWGYMLCGFSSNMSLVWCRHRVLSSLLWVLYTGRAVCGSHCQSMWWENWLSRMGWAGPKSERAAPIYSRP